MVNTQVSLKAPFVLFDIIYKETAMLIIFKEVTVILEAILPFIKKIIRASCRIISRAITILARRIDLNVFSVFMVSVFKNKLA